MFKICYITDTHIGSDGKGWCQQPPCPHKLPQLFLKLSEVVSKESIDLLILGGDATNNGNIEQIESLKTFLNMIPVKFRLVLGNHDLQYPESLDVWKSNFPEAFKSDIASTFCDFGITLGDYFVIGLQNAWGNTESDMSHYWNNEVTCSGLIGGQLKWLKEVVSKNSTKRIILFMHDSIFPLDEIIASVYISEHSIKQFYKRNIILNAHNINLVVSGHCHATTRQVINGQNFITTSAFIEPPFQFCIFTLEDSRLQGIVKNFDSLARDCQFDASKAWVIGGDYSHFFEIDFN